MTTHRPHLRPATRSKKAASAVAFLATLGVSTLDALPVAADSTDADAADSTLVLPPEFDAYLESEYNYFDAEILAELWGFEDVYDAKIKLGSLLKAGLPVPIEPGSPAPEIDVDTLAANAFFDSDYTYQDALELAEFWGLEDPYDAKLKIGFALKAGAALPIEPGEAVGPLTLYYYAGYGWGDGEDLAEYWGSASTEDAKYKAAALLEQGQPLPLHSRSVANQAFNLYGYGWGDAVELAEFWGLDHPNDAKIKAGRELKAGGSLPQAPRLVALDRFIFEGYSWADAVELADYWGFDDENDAKIKAGRLLKAGFELPLADA